jgi:hypothetical protein
MNEILMNVVNLIDLEEAAIYIYPKNTVSPARGRKMKSEAGITSKKQMVSLYSAPGAPQAVSPITLQQKYAENSRFCTRNLGRRKSGFQLSYKAGLERKEMEAYSFRVANDSNWSTAVGCNRNVFCNQVRGYG